MLLANISVVLAVADLKFWQLDFPRKKIYWRFINGSHMIKLDWLGTEGDNKVAITGYSRSCCIVMAIA